MGGRERRREGNGRKRGEEIKDETERGKGEKTKRKEMREGEKTPLGPVGTGFDLELLYGVNSAFSVASGVLAADQMTTLSLNLKIIVFIGCWRMGGPSLSIPRCTCNTSTLFAGR